MSANGSSYSISQCKSKCFFSINMFPIVHMVVKKKLLDKKYKITSVSSQTRIRANSAKNELQKC